MNFLDFSLECVIELPGCEGNWGEVEIAWGNPHRTEHFAQIGHSGEGNLASSNRNSENYGKPRWAFSGLCLPNKIGGSLLPRGGSWGGGA